MTCSKVAKNNSETISAFCATVCQLVFKLTWSIKRIDVGDNEPRFPACKYCNRVIATNLAFADRLHRLF